MIINDIHIADNIRVKLLFKHNVDEEEIREVFLGYYSNDIYIVSGKSRTYNVYGRTSEGRYLYIVFKLRSKVAHIITSYEMDDVMKRFYKKKEK